MSVILMTTLFYKVLILQGEIWFWSLLGLKGLKCLILSQRYKTKFHAFETAETGEPSILKES